MADLEGHEKEKSPKQIIQEKEAEIIELKDDLAKENFMISFLEQENMPLEVNHIFISKPRVDLVADDDKGKRVIDVE